MIDKEILLNIKRKQKNILYFGTVTVEYMEKILDYWKDYKKDISFNFNNQTQKILKFFHENIKEEIYAYNKDFYFNLFLNYYEIKDNKIYFELDKVHTKSNKNEVLTLDEVDEFTITFL